MNPTNPSSPKTSVSIKMALDLRWVVVALVVIIGVMLALWKPWSSATNSDRTIEVTGEATITATPDEFVFYPSYQFVNAEKDAALSELSKKSDTVVTELKKLGVAEKDIKTASSGYETSFMPDKSGELTYTLTLTVTVNDLDLAQKVQDYLVGTGPMGSVSPMPIFSDAKSKELEAQARDEATKAARAKADQTGKNLGFKVGKVKSIADGSGFAVPFIGRAELSAPDSTTSSSLGLHPGENELPYSITVVYYIN